MKTALLALFALLATPVYAAEECNGFLNISYPGAQIVNTIGETLQVRIDLGAGTITGGPLNVLQITNLGFDLSCADPPVPDCPSEGPVMSYDGDATITSTCPGVLTSDNPAGGATPSHVTFTFTPLFSIPHDKPIPPGFCSFTFTETILAQTSNPTGVIEQVIGYDLAQCDNGVLLSGGFQTGAVPVEVVQEHLDCYQTPRAKIPPQAVTLVDRFGTTTAKLVDIHELCAPADKNGENPGAELNPLHYASATIGSSTGFTKVFDLSIDTQFGTYTADVTKPFSVLLPASKGLTGFLPPIEGEHFQCYKLGGVKGPAPAGIHVTDQFVDELSVDINSRGPDKLCVSVQKNGEGGPPGPKAFLCLRTKNDTLPFGQKDLFLTTQFGQKKLFISQYDELCTSATIQDGDETTTSTTTTTTSTTTTTTTAS